MNFVDRAVAGLVPHLPRPLVGVVARRYIAGETLEQALAACVDLNAKGMTITLDLLGENIEHLGQATETMEAYRDVVRQIRAREVDGNISIKLTAFGLKLDRRRCAENVRALVDVAREHDLFVRIDMEESTTTTDTLDLYRELREVTDQVGVVLQARLKRSERDAEDLAKMGARIRVCKGIYQEPADIAYQDPDEIRASYLRIVELLLAQRCHVGIATHDDPLIDGAAELLKKHDTPRDLYEYQMLLGVRSRRRDEIVAAGHPLRVYVPYGEQWHPYSVRRLQENPEIAGHVFRAFLGLD